MRKSSRWVHVAVALSLAIAVAGCSDDDDASSDTSAAPASSSTTAGDSTTSTTTPAGDEQYVANAAEFVDAADWDAAEELTIELSEFAFAPKDITLEAGTPYVITLTDVGDVKHEFTSGAFFRSVATRKAETAQSEVKVPYFTEVEVFAGKSAELFLIPLIPGTYELVCEIEGHLEAGMFGTITVTGTTPESPELELADVASGPWVQDGPALVEAADWDAAGEMTIVLSEYAFTPKDITLETDKPYILTVVNEGEVKHEFTAAEFFETVAFRKAEDASGEFKGPVPKEIEVFPGEEIEVFLIPTEDGTYDLLCEIEGHLEAGMSGTITVAPAS